MKKSTFQDQPRTYGFPPLLCEEPRILLLRTLPGGESLEHQQYYDYDSNSNRRWKVLCYLTGEPMPADYNQKKAFRRNTTFPNPLTSFTKFRLAVSKGQRITTENLLDQRCESIVFIV